MAEKLTLDQGTELLKLARQTIEQRFSGKKELTFKIKQDPAYAEKKGVFVTLNTFPEGKLRGCIGIPYPIKALASAVAEAGFSAAFGDPRFKDITKEDIDKITLELTVLTIPKQINTEDKKKIPEQIKLGQDGLIIKRSIYTGLLLPQVPVDHGWDTEEFLCQTCYKAGLSPESWLQKEVEIYKFQGQIFKEEKPNGKIVEKDITSKKC